MSERHRIRYRFELPDGSKKTLEFHFDSVDFTLCNPHPPEPRFWTALGFNQCANCPLDSARTAHCPAALQMGAAIEPLQALVSFDTVAVTVVQSGRSVHVDTTAQQAMSSVLGFRRSRGSLQEPACGQSRYVTSAGCGGAHRSGAQCNGIAGCVCHLVAGGAR
jgi:hypothetical protein